MKLEVLIEDVNNVFWTKHYSKIRAELKEWCTENNAGYMYLDGIGSYTRFTIHDKNIDDDNTKELILNFTLKFVTGKI